MRRGAPLLSLALLGACTCTPRGGPGADGAAGVGSGWDGKGPAPDGSALSQALARTDAPPPGSDCVHRGAGTDYPVGPGQKYARLGDVPFESLRAGDTVRVFHRAEPYHEKTMLSGQGTAAQPIRLCGVPGPNGELPVLDGANATTRPELDFPFDGHQGRGLVIVGKRHGDPWKYQPQHLVIEGLELRHADPEHRFVDRQGKEQAYTESAAGVFVQRATAVTIRGCTVTRNRNGLFVGSGGGEELTRDVVIEGNWIHDNGSPDGFYNHNVYNESSGVLIQHNRFGSPRRGKEGVLGGNIKERSAGVVIRYNWIEDGAHLIDLVDAQEARDTTLPMPSFHESWVIGNVLVRGEEPNGSMVHYGGDSGLPDTYRKGTLHFVQNTVVVFNDRHPAWRGTSVFELSTDDEALDSRNNLYVSSSPPHPDTQMILLGSRDSSSPGRATFAGDFVSTGWVPHDTLRQKDLTISATWKGFEELRRGGDPGFSDLRAGDLRLTPGASVLASGVPLTGLPEPLAVRAQYARHQRVEPRELGEPPTPGAFGVRP